MTQISITKEDLKLIDEFAKKEDRSRSSFLRACAKEKIKEILEKKNANTTNASQ